MMKIVSIALVASLAANISFASNTTPQSIVSAVDSVYSHPYLGGSNSLQINIPAGTQPQSITAFNPSWGRLQSVEIGISGNLGEFGVWIENDTLDEQRAELAGAESTLIFALQNLANDATIILSNAFTVTTPDTSWLVPGQPTPTSKMWHTYEYDLPIKFSTSVSTGDWLAFQGASNNLSLMQVVSGSLKFGEFKSQDDEVYLLRAQIYGRIISTTVNYNYSVAAVPEPSIALAMFALLPLLVFSTRRKGACSTFVDARA
jgi:hypothetical protein